MKTSRSKKTVISITGRPTAQQQKISVLSDTSPFGVAQWITEQHVESAEEAQDIVDLNFVRDLPARSKSKHSVVEPPTKEYNTWLENDFPILSWRDMYETKSIQSVTEVF